MIVGLAAMLLAIVLVGGALVGGVALFQRAARRLGAPEPLVSVCALAAGLCFGAALLLAAPDRAAFAPARLFSAGAHWQDAYWRDGTAGAALRLALPGEAALRGALAGLAGEGGAALVAAAWLAAGGAGLGMAAIWRACRGRARLLALGAFAALAAGTGLAMHYATQLLAWGLAQIGFWVLLLALLGLQAWRRRRAAAH